MGVTGGMQGGGSTPKHGGTGQAHDHRAPAPSPPSNTPRHPHPNNAHLAGPLLCRPRAPDAAVNMVCWGGGRPHANGPKYND